MEKTLTTRALILKAQTYQERDQWLTLLTEEEGLVLMRSHNSLSSKRFGNSLQPWSLSQVSLRFKNAQTEGTLEEAHILHAFCFPEWKDLTTACLLGELILKIAPPHEKALHLFRLFIHTLVSLEKQPPQSSLEALGILTRFSLKLLHWAGLAPQLTGCLHCSRSLTPLGPSGFFFFEVGGWHCASCPKPPSLKACIPWSFATHQQLQNLLESRSLANVENTSASSFWLSFLEGLFQAQLDLRWPLLKSFPSWFQAHWGPSSDTHSKSSAGSST